MNATPFAHEFNRLSQYLRAFAYKLTGDASAADDLFQDTAFLAFKNQDKFQSKTNLKAWLSTIMKNAFINSFRKRKRRGQVLDSSPEYFLLNSNASTTNNEGEAAVQYQDLFSLVEMLNENLKQPFLMAYHGYKYEEIGQELSLPVGTIKSRVFAARKFLKAQIGQRYMILN